MQERFRRASALPLLLVAAWLWRAKRRAELRAERAEAECQELKSSGVALCAEIRAELLAFSGRVSVAEGPSPISLCLDDCLGIIVSHLQSAVHLANAAMVSNAFRTACRDEAQLRVRGRLVCMRSNYTNPYESGADQIELAAEYAGGWIALLAGREGWLDTSRTAGAPDYEGVPSYTVEHGLDALYNSWNVKSDRSDAGSYAAESKAYDASPAAALCLWDVVRLQTDNVPTGRVRRGEIVWSGVLPLLDQLSVEALHVPNQRVATSNVCRMAVTVPCAASMAEFLPGDRREWRPQTFAVGSDRQSTNDGLHEASPRYLVSGSLDPAADTYLIRLSLLAPGCAETLVCQKSLPSVLDMHVLVGEPLPPHVETLHENGVEAIRLDTGRIDRFEEVDDEDGNVEVSGQPRVYEFRFKWAIDKSSTPEWPTGWLNYFDIACWVEYEPEFGRAHRYHIDLSLVKEDRLWEADLAGANRTPRLLAARCKECGVWRLTKAARTPREMLLLHADGTEAADLRQLCEVRWVPSGVELSLEVARGGMSTAGGSPIV